MSDVASVKSNTIIVNAITHSLTIPAGMQFIVGGNNLTVANQKVIKLLQTADGSNNFVVEEGGEVDVKQTSVEDVRTTKIREVVEAGGLNHTGDIYYTIPYAIDLEKTHTIRLTCCNDMQVWTRNRLFQSARSGNFVYDIVFRDGKYNIIFGNGKNGVIPTNNPAFINNTRYYYRANLEFSILIEKTEGSNFFSVGNTEVQANSDQIESSNGVLQDNFYSQTNSLNQVFSNIAGYRSNLLAALKDIISRAFLVSDAGIFGGSQDSNIENLRNEALNNISFSDKVISNDDYETYIRQFENPIFLKFWGENVQAELEGGRRIDFINKAFYTFYFKDQDADTSTGDSSVKEQKKRAIELRLYGLGKISLEFKYIEPEFIPVVLSINLKLAVGSNSSVVINEMVEIIRDNYSKNSVNKLDFININDVYKLLSDNVELPTDDSNYTLEFTKSGEVVRDLQVENIKQYIFIQRIVVTDLNDGSNTNFNI